ncbi:MAG: branched-chain amino acid ABC transporter periplasmic protein [Bacteroidetes bacterium]|nr:MAG: branched-chain amino acid ABC transporter periplasmic protein [Bacteroidota bacterium]
MGISSNVMTKHILSILLLVLALSASHCSLAQDGIKKSTKTQVIEGKKYYIHKVDKGQTLYAIAKAYELTVNDIILENPDAINGIKPGQELKVPFVKPGTKPVTTSGDTVVYFWHKVEQGQTLYTLSKIYAVKVEQIEKLNPGSAQGLKAGQQIKIPGVKKMVTTVPVFLDSNKVPKDTFPFKEIKKELYHVALFMPLNYWKTDEINVDKILQNQQVFPPRTELALQFYEGLTLAIDSLQKRGLKIKLHVYDSDENDSTAILTTLKKPEMEKMDLFIGPFYPGPFAHVAKYAASKNVCAVSPVSQANRVLFSNPTAAKTTPAVSTQMEFLANHVNTAHKTKKVVVISSGSPKEQFFINSFKKSFDTLRHARGNDTVTVIRGMAGLSPLLSPDTTILIIPSNSQAFVTDLMRGLNEVAEKHKLIVYGAPGWINYDNLDYEYLQAVQLHFPSPYFIDYEDSLTKIFTRKYAAAYKGDANMYVFMGYDIGMYYLDALYRLGTGFHARMPELRYTGLQQKFEFVKTDNGSGYENRAVNLVRMIDYKLVKRN